MGITYFGTYPASGSDQVVSTSLTTILSLAQQWNPIEDNFGVWDLEIQNNGARDITEIQFRHSIDNVSYTAYPDISDAAAAVLVPLLAAGEKLRLRLFIPVGILRVQAKSTAADGAVLTLFERSEVSYSEPLVNGTKLSALVASTGSAAVAASASMPLQKLFSASHEMDIAPLFFHTNVVGAGTVTHEDDLSAADLYISRVDTDAAHMQSMRRFKFNSASKMLFKFDFLFGAAQANIVRKVGLFDALDGFFFLDSGAATPAYQFVARSSSSGASVDTAVDQDDWNVDPLDGTGVSGKTLDLTNIQQLYITVAYGQAGYVEMGFMLDGAYCAAHRFFIANNQAVPAASWLSLPMAALIINNGGSVAADDMYMFDWFAGAYGDASLEPVSVGVTLNGVTPNNLGAGNLGVIGVRPKNGSNYEFGGVAFKDADILCEANATYMYRVVVGESTILSSGWGTAADTDTGRTEYAEDNVACTGGVTVKTGFGLGPKTITAELNEILAAWPALIAASSPQAVAIEVTAIDALNLHLSMNVLELM